MPKVYFMKGLPGSGKTTKAKEMLKAHPGRMKRINKDDLRDMIDGGEWSRPKEKFILEVRNLIATKALDAGFDVIIDDTNFAAEHEEVMRGIARSREAGFEIIDLSGVSVEICIERDKGRGNKSVGERVILDMHKKYLSPKRDDIHPKAPEFDPNLPNAIICDIDGTVAYMVDRGPFELDKVYGDRVRGIVADVVAAFAKKVNAKILFVSGRDAACSLDTQRWISTKLYPVSEYSWMQWDLFMRPKGDMRKDSIVKREIYEANIKGKYNVLAVFDDRPQIIRTWRYIGLGDRLFDVGNGVEF